MTIKKHSIIIADDHPLLLKGLHDFLIEKNFNIINSATNGLEAYNLIIRHNPDIAILDIQMPKMSGLEIAKKCKNKGIKAKIIILTLHKDPSLFIKAKELNIFGYVLKDFAIEEIENCIASVIKNVPYFSKSIMNLLDNKTITNNSLKNLTPSEIKILSLIANDKTNKEIANQLFISPRTVEKHRSNIINKLKLEQKTHSLLIWAKENQKLLIEKYV